MSVARFSENCDVYVYPTGPAPNNYCCDGCRLLPKDGPRVFFTETAQEMVVHLKAHRAAGHLVPGSVFAKLLERTP